LHAALITATAASWARADDAFFESRIRPVLVGTCFRCHGGTKTSGALRDDSGGGLRVSRGGLRVDSRETLLQGGDSGPAIVPGNPHESLLIKAIQRQADVSPMPPEKEKALRPDQVADFVSWVDSGAAWPDKSDQFETAKHWAYEPIRDASPPNVQDAGWISTSVDAFIRAKQEAAGVRPAGAADKLTLIRRATFDLTGLPPAPEEVDAFIHDTSPLAFEAVIDRLLASPAHGERWGRHWLDVVRYADTAGETADYPVPLAWRYRNYVIDAFNADKPYDEFLREQIAGDVLAGQGPPERYAERVTATGYLAISRRFGFDSENYHHLTIQDTIDTLGQSVLGLSLGCARCHDHKFDAVSMHDYYGLYGIFDSSRYAFPGSEQKPRVRSLAPLLPPSEAQPKWRAFENRLAAVAGKLAGQKPPVPTAVLRSLTDIDGDFELQAPAAGGSNGVLVPPWLYQGRIAVTTAAQSPFTNLYRPGRVGASVPAATGRYSIAQALYPRRTPESCDVLHLNIDFRVAAAEGAQRSAGASEIGTSPSPGSSPTARVGEDVTATGVHHLTLGTIGAAPAVEVLIAAETLALRAGESLESLGAVQPNRWYNLQLDLELARRTVSGRFGTPSSMTEFSGKPLSPHGSCAVDFVELSSLGPTETNPPAIEFDNLGVQETPFVPVSTQPPVFAGVADEADYVALTERLQALQGIDGDFELQTEDSPPTSPWNPGPNSVVKLAASSQSPHRNIFAPGRLGIHMPNRGEYDGFGLTLSNVKPDKEGRLHVSFDFRCANQEAGGSGSWRYYLGHGPGNSAAVELFFNGSKLDRRSADANDTVGPLVIGEWYQVQLALDLKAHVYTGVLQSRAGKTDFAGQLASRWDGTIDYSFIDSYGHIGGVRPSLDADNFAVGDTGFPPVDAPPLPLAEVSHATRRSQIAEIRGQIAALQAKADHQRHELETQLADGPFAMTYGMAEGTPHNVHTQRRGEPDQPGEEVPRGFIEALGGGALPAETPGSGRLELAQWLTRPDNPLTARVMVNRIWQYHFGRGLVQTPNDFGVRGLPPTHPELLDHLAKQFIRSGWSVKAMHRLIMLSATYRQSSDSGALEFATRATPLANAPDGTPVTDLYVGFPRRRLSAEEIRDAILAVSGELDATPAREHPFPSPIYWGYSQHDPFSAIYDHDRRSVYLMTQRLKRHPFLALFDGADPNSSTPQRLGTTVPTQALFFLNDPFVHAKAERWASRLLTAATDEAQRIAWAWHRAFGRLPTDSERAEAIEFLAACRGELAAANRDHLETRALAAYLRALFASNEFLHVD
jgi:hypothetical protein